MLKKIDDLGRVVIPKEMRDDLGIKPGDKIYVELEKKTRTICMRKELATCLCYGKGTELKEFAPGMALCKACVEKLV